jgi:hypothetical protein
LQWHEPRDLPAESRALPQGDRRTGVIGTDTSDKKQDHIGKVSKREKNKVARASDRTIKKLLKTEDVPACKDKKSHGR